MSARPSRDVLRRLARQRARWLGRTRPGSRRLAWAVAAVLVFAAYAVALAWQPVLAWWARLHSTILPESYSLGVAGRQILRVASALPFFLVPVLFAPIFAGEKELGTMEALCLTPMRRRTILAGRFRAAWRPVGFFLLAALPLFLFLPRSLIQGHPFVCVLPGWTIFGPGLPPYALTSAPGYATSLQALSSSDLYYLGTAYPPRVTGATIAAGAAVWAWVWVNAWALAWIATAFSLRVRTRLRALVWSLAASAVLLALAYGVSRGVLYLCTHGIARGAHARLLWDLRPAAIGGTVAEIALVGLAGLLVYRVLPRRSDRWAMGKEA